MLGLRSVTLRSPDDHPPRAARVDRDLSPEQVAAEIRGTLGTLYRRIRQTKQIGDLTLPESSALSRVSSRGYPARSVGNGRAPLREWVSPVPTRT